MQAAAAGRLGLSSSSALSSSSSAAASAAAAAFRSRRRVIIGIPGVLHRFNIKKRGKSFTASLPPNLPKPQKGKKSRIEGRRALVESFVNKLIQGKDIKHSRSRIVKRRRQTDAHRYGIWRYVHYNHEDNLPTDTVNEVCRYRTENAGRFPTASFVRQEVGGSYYTVRQIVQELEYKPKFSPLKSIDAAESGEVAEESIQDSKEVNYLLKKLEKVSGTTEKISLSTHDPDKKVDKKVPSVCDGNEILGKSTNQSFNPIEDCSSSDADPKVDVWDQSLKANFQSSWSNVNTQVKKDDDQSFSPKSDPDIKNTETYESRGGKEEGNKQVADKEEKQSEIPGRSNGETSSKASSLWKNLRSFTDGILSLWKKL